MTPVFIFASRDGEWLHFNAVLPEDGATDRRSFKVDADEFGAGWELIGSQVEAWLEEDA